MNRELQEHSFLETFILSFVLTAFVTGVFAFVGFVYPTNHIMFKDYYRVKNPQRLKRIYALLGVDYFRKALMLAFWGRQKNRKKYFSGNKDGMDDLIFQSKQSEFGHLGAFVVCLILSILLLLKGYWLLFLLITVINIIGNYYPIPLQRMHRMRIDRIRKNS